MSRQVLNSSHFLVPDYERLRLGTIVLLSLPSSFPRTHTSPINHGADSSPHRSPPLSYVLQPRPQPVSAPASSWSTYSYRPCHSLRLGTFEVDGDDQSHVCHIRERAIAVVNIGTQFTGQRKEADDDGPEAGLREVSDGSEGSLDAL